jgi:hypothetical protein
MPVMVIYGTHYEMGTSPELVDVALPFLNGAK